MITASIQHILTVVIICLSLTRSQPSYLRSQRSFSHAQLSRQSARTADEIKYNKSFPPRKLIEDHSSAGHVSARLKRNARVEELSCLKGPHCYHNVSFQPMTSRPVCRCDELCSKFGDCCEGTSLETTDPDLDYHSLQYDYLADDTPTSCKYLPYSTNPISVFMISDCPKNTTDSHRLLCRKEVLPQHYHYSLDIPVISQSYTHRVYQNIHCAKCHEDFKMKPIKAHLNCMGDEVSGRKYVEGELRWELDNSTYCVLLLDYDVNDVRWCAHKVIKNCSLPAKEDLVEECRQYGTSYVHANGQYFQNYFCARCNGVEASNIHCPPTLNTIDATVHAGVHRTHPITLYSRNTQCSDSEVVDPMTNKCLEFQCDHTKCPSHEIETFPDAVSQIERNCIKLMFRHKYSIIYPNGTIYLREQKMQYDFGEYHLIGDKWMRVCSTEQKWSPTMFILSRVLFAVSLICLALHMIIFILLPRKRNIPSMNLLSLTIALFIADLIFITLFRSPEYPKLCVVSSLVLYYFLSAAFLWMNVLSIDIYRTFRSNTYKITSNRAFIQYSIYAWLVPILTTSIVYTVDQTAPRDFILLPDFGSSTCWFNNKWGLAAFFSAPACIIIMINMSLYGLSVYVIVQQHKLGKLASSTANLRSKENVTKENNRNKTRTDIVSGFGPTGSFKSRMECDKETFFKEKFKEKIQKKMRMHKKLCLRLALYSKLAIIMGMTWIFAFLSFHTRSSVLEYFFILFNGLQGTFIFIAFDCKQKVWHNLKQRLGIELNSQAMMNSSTGEVVPRTESTHLRLMSYKASTKSSSTPQVDSLTCV